MPYNMLIMYDQKPHGHHSHRYSDMSLPKTSISKVLAHLFPLLLQLLQLLVDLL